MEIQPIIPQSVRSSAWDEVVLEKAPVMESESVHEAPDSRPPEPVATPTDRVEISEQALEMARAHAAVQKAPDVRADRVAEIKRQVKEGTYSVPAEILADRLLGGR